MPVFQESDLTFEFSDKDWQIKKYDEHRFYRILSGSGLKGVDFIGIYKNEKLVLIEVKNYVDRYFEDEINPSENFIENYKTFVPIFAKKFKDSIRLIQIIHSYYQRKGWFRFFEKWIVPHFFIQNKLNWDWIFWWKTAKILDNTENVEMILWLEIEGEFEKESDFIKLMKKELEEEKGQFYLNKKMPQFKKN